MTSLPFTPLLGLDNALVALALAPVLQGRAVRLGALFGGAGFLAAALGSALKPLAANAAIGMFAGPSEAARVATLVVVAVAILGLAVVSWRPRLAGTTPALVGLTLLLSVDDLVAGLGLDPSAATFVRLASDSIACGVLSMCAAFVGQALARPLAVREAALLSAGLLLGCAAVGLA